MSLTAWDLLSRGYFPKELPPTFSTEAFASRVLYAIGGMPVFLSNYREAELCPHSVGRIGGFRRTLSIPNPIPYLQLCLLIGRNWSRISGRIRQSPLSISYPVVNQERAVVPGEKDLSRERVRIRRSANYVAVADISRFYHSIYTHTIEWALHGKAKAKQRRGKAGRGLLGRRLDDWVRACQAGQSVGLPVGPDTSLILAELVGASLDEQLLRRKPTLAGIRFIDDFEFGCDTASQGAMIIGRLQDCLAKLELGLNHGKTRVDPLPTHLDEEWKRQVQFLDIVARSDSNGDQLIWFFDGVIDIAKQHPTKGVIGYALSRMRTMDVSPGNWDLFQDLLLQLSTADPGAFPIALSKLAHVHKLGEAVDRLKLSKFANAQMGMHANLGHANEVAWLLWAALVFELRLSRASAKAVSRMTDAVVVLLALHAASNAIFESPLDTVRWRSMLRRESLFKSQWLLAYECGVKGWLKSPKNKYLRGEPGFAWLADIGVEFYDVNGAEPIGPSGFEEMAWLDELDAAAESRARHYGHGSVDIVDLEDADIDALLGDDDNIPF